MGEVIVVEERYIDDLVVLGKAVPERMRDRRTTVCTAGYSPKLGFVRIYPTTYNSPLKRWNIVELPVERDKQDSRPESWKIQGSRSEWDTLDTKIKKIGELTPKEGFKLVSKKIDSSIRQLNEQRRSLGILRPNIQKCYFRKNETYDSTKQEKLFGGFTPNIKNQYPYTPYVRYRCSECKAVRYHDQQVLEWGFYEGMRRNPDDIDIIWENSGMNSRDWNHLFFVGNQRHQRTSFMIISVLRVKHR